MQILISVIETLTVVGIAILVITHPVLPSHIITFIQQTALGPINIAKSSG